MQETMKKAILFVAAATMFLLSCQREDVKPESKSFSFTASIEELASKADMNASNQLVWAKGDQIGIYVNGWSANSNQSFTLKGDGGSTTGSFGRTSENWFETDQAKVAFFPWTSANATTVDTGTDNNVSVSDGIMYFKLRQDYNDYTSGKMLTPLVAPVTWNGSAYDPIEFKHAGAAIKVVVSDFPAGAKTLGITVKDQNIYGTFSINPANAGTSGMVLVSSEAKGDNVWIHVEPAAAARDFTFIFPVPELTTPSITFNMYDKNDVLVWSREAKNQPSLIHGNVLAMPAVSITPYKKFNAVSGWGVCGTHNSWGGDTPMVTDGTFSIAKGLTLPVNAEFKVRTVGSWGTDGVNNFGGGDLKDSDSYAENNGGNVKIKVAGTYDIIFSTSDNKIKVVPTGECPYPAVQQNGGSTTGFTNESGFNTGWTL